MPQSLSNIIIHIIFSTKNRVPYLTDPDIRQRLHLYMGGICIENGSYVHIVGGVADHVHLLCSLSRNRATADLVRAVKTSSTTWLKVSYPGYSDFHWQGGYAAFSVSPSRLDQVKIYIARQEDHHRRIGYKDELRAALKKHHINFDERYIWD